jgi:serine/threonine protein kinase/Tol biopolymer transport system component
MADELTGQTLGQYHIQMVLGKGGMSTVYMAHQPSMDRTVAIKVLPRAFLHDDTFLIRFQTEARTIAKLEHLHILPVYDVGEDQGIPYIVMRYLTGGTLADLIETRLPNMSTVIRIVEQIADALDYAHAHNIIHRDMKPSNILLDSSGNAYLADFGIARVAEQAASLTGSRVIGTPPYIAPEMIRKGEEVTHSADIYALGSITFEMLTGDPPYVDDDPTKVLMAHVLEPVPSVRSFDPNISPEVDAVVQRCLAKNPYGRYDTASEFATALAKANQPGQVRTAPSEEATVPVEAARPAPPPAPQPREPRKKEASTADVPIEAEEARPRLNTGCLLVGAVILAVIGAVMIAAYMITGGDPGSLLSLMTPLPTRTPQPTVTPTPSEDEEEPTPSAESGDTSSSGLLPPPTSGARLAFASNRDGDYEIFVIEVDGSNLLQLTDNNAADFDPAWSPDGSQIVFASATDGDAEIKIMNADGSNPQPITANGADDTDPAWSPDGELIAFSSDRDGDFEIYVMRPDGSDERQLTFNSVNDYTPSWSPSGARIAYYSKSGGNSDLYVLDAIGGQPYQLTTTSELERWPDWSPDGLRIVYTSAVGLPEGSRAVFVIDLAGGEPIQLTPGENCDDDPVWSLDGTRIAFDSARLDPDSDQTCDSFDNFNLFIFDMATRTLQQLTSDAGNNVAPAWQP